MSTKKVEILRKNLDKDLKRGFIRESDSPTGYPILFAKKNDPNEP